MSCYTYNGFALCCFRRCRLWERPRACWFFEWRCFETAGFAGLITELQPKCRIRNALSDELLSNYANVKAHCLRLVLPLNPWSMVLHTNFWLIHRSQRRKEEPWLILLRCLEVRFWDINVIKHLDLHCLCFGIKFLKNWSCSNDGQCPTHSHRCHHSGRCPT